ncbi:MAG TPA: lipoyl(octanoyl) transferase LipB [Candidatus Methylomirabilis sp.]|nr:lipoyl(octanoyl) transferase LipB [Candidatus Methylomirabilis sp.]
MTVTTEAPRVETYAPVVWQVLDLGLQPYGPTLRHQEELVRRRLLGSIPDSLILVEHTPVVTVGRAKPHGNLRLTPEELAARGVDFFEITRGGDVTYHAPGQLVGYPVFDLRQHGRDVLRFCRNVEAALVAALGDFGLKAEAIPGDAGVWIGEKKIASLGISVRRWVTFHGFALNVSTDLSGFQVIRPCGKDPEVMTSMVALLRHPVSMEEVRRRVVLRFAESFGFVESLPASG